MTLHNTLLERVLKRYKKEGFLVVKEAKYKGFIFDIIAFNPETKETCFIEIEVASNSKKRKIELASKIGKVILIEPEINKTKIPFSTEKVCDALAGLTRLRILRSLSDNNLNFTNLGYSVGLNVREDIGRFAYHVKKLLEAGLIKKSGKEYLLTSKGKMVVRFLDELENISKEL